MTPTPRPPPVIWATYMGLEEEMTELLAYVPWDEANVNVWSPKPANLLLNIGSSIDSTFKTFKNSRYLAAGENSENLREKSEPNIGDYATTYASAYPVATKAVYFLEDHSAWTPWKDWKASKAPDWWTAYNRVKHNRFENYRLATLKTTLTALAGFFSVCVLLLETRNHLFSLGKIGRVDFMKREGMMHIETWTGVAWLEVLRYPNLGDRFELPVYVNTPLFAVFLSSDKNVQGQKELLDQIAPM